MEVRRVEFGEFGSGRLGLLSLFVRINCFAALFALV